MLLYCVKPLRTDYERRQALVEIDVLAAMALGLTLDQLKTIYHIQFPILQQYEADTWYDANGRIVFTTNRGLTGVGFDRKEWESSIKGAPAGKKYYKKQALPNRVGRTIDPEFIGRAMATLKDRGILNLKANSSSPYGLVIYPK